LSLGAAELVWVQRSASRISLHRALGASRTQIRGSVHWDLFRLVTLGCVLGLLLGMQVAPRVSGLPWALQTPPATFAGGLLLAAIAVSQLLATWPARRAANVAPHHVTRKPWVRL
ncbi:MAG TPA: FtsX-like permease family protein, partial [Pseudoxanthomonas sp.]|nr:FtsX-like permease family protein [Pseudoxanthomonas sp.]